MASAPYFEVPKILNTDPRYAPLSIEAKYLYAYMRDTLKLSIKNGWRDNAGYYIRMTREKMAAFLGRSLPTVRRYLRQLTRAGLLREKREGLTRSNRLYIQLTFGEDETAFRSVIKKASPQQRKPDYTTERKPLPPNEPHSIDPHPTEPKKDGWKWFIKEGDRWFDRAGKLWQFTEGEVCPYLYGDELKKNASDLLRQIGMSDQEIAGSLSMV